MDTEIDIALAMTIVTLCSFFIYMIGMTLHSTVVLLVAFSGCTFAMILGLAVMVIRYRESRM